MTADDSGSASVVVTTEGAVRILRINRPQAMNAIDGDVSTRIAEAILRAEADDEVRALLITGTGDRAFSAGADLKALARGEALVPQDPELRAFGFGGCTERLPAKPLVAAVNGLAYGGGFEIALAADVIVADPRARFALPEVTRGIIPGGGGAVRLPRQLPRQVAQWMLLTGLPLDAERAYGLGLVAVLSDPGEALATALETAQRIAANAPLAVAATRRIASVSTGGLPTDELDAWRLNTVLVPEVQRSRDADEGARAFIEKRSPAWEGR